LGKELVGPSGIIRSASNSRTQPEIWEPIPVLGATFLNGLADAGCCFRAVVQISSKDVLFGRIAQGKQPPLRGERGSILVPERVLGLCGRMHNDTTGCGQQSWGCP